MGVCEELGLDGLETHKTSPVLFWERCAWALGLVDYL